MARRGLGSAASQTLLCVDGHQSGLLSPAFPSTFLYKCRNRSVVPAIQIRGTAYAWRSHLQSESLRRTGQTPAAQPGWRCTSALIYRFDSRDYRPVRRHAWRCDTEPERRSSKSGAIRLPHRKVRTRLVRRPCTQVISAERDRFADSQRTEDARCVARLVTHLCCRQAFPIRRFSAEISCLLSLNRHQHCRFQFHGLW